MNGLALNEKPAIFIWHPANFNPGLAMKREIIKRHQ
jgi:hypothetical protein